MSPGICSSPTRLRGPPEVCVHTVLFYFILFFIFLFFFSNRLEAGAKHFQQSGCGWRRRRGIFSSHHQVPSSSQQGVLIEGETWGVCVITGACRYCATDGPEQTLQLGKWLSSYLCPISLSLYGGRGWGERPTGRIKLL